MRTIERRYQKYKMGNHSGNKKNFYRACPICQCGKGKVMHKITLNLPASYALPKSYDVVCCEICGFIFADTQAGQKNYEYYYKYCNLYHDVGKVKKGLYEETHKMDFTRIQKYCKKEDQILDIGCGNGGILKLLSENGYKNLYGLDPSENSIDYLFSIGLSGRIGDIYSEIPEMLKQKFDFIICTAVLEHLLFPEIAIKQIKDYLKPQGKIYITVPGIEGFAIYKNLVADYFNHEHINFFNEYSLIFLMKKFGFTRLSEEKDNNYVIDSRPPEFVLSAVFEHTGVEEMMMRNDIAEIQIDNYFKDNQEREKRIINHVETFICGADKIAVWGTGSSAMWLLDHIPSLNEKVEYYVDNNAMKIGEKFAGKTIDSPCKLQSNPNMRIIICIMINVEEVQEQMKQMKINNPYYILGNIK